VSTPEHRRNSDDPTEQPEPDAHAYGAVLSPGGTILSVPHALTVGRPRPEPDERWTLGPRGHDETTGDEEGDRPAVEKVGRPKLTHPG
jgi:hypothetical protein